MHALEVCEDDRLNLALNLAFSCSLRMGEMLGLTWDCVDISEEAIVENRAYIYVDKEVQRVDKAAIQELRGKDVIQVFPEESKKNKTVRVLKLPKTESSIRKVFLPKSVAEMLVEWKKGQDKIKETLGDEYMDYNLVMATPFGLPIGTSSIRKALNDLIKEHDLPPVVFHSLRHTSVTYKLKLNGGDIKAVQGDSGHSQINMVTDVYSHIIDDDRRKNAELFEQAFYEKKNLDPSMHANVAGKTVELPTNVDAELLAKVLSNPEMAAGMSSRYYIRSNRESGEGRFDLVLEPKVHSLPGVIMEFKATKDDAGLSASADEALKQIEDKHYDTDMKDRGIKEIVKYGIAFAGKNVEIAIGFPK